MNAWSAAGRGFRFGMLLQLAVGPVCLYVLQAASGHGFPAGMLSVSAVTAVDGAFIALAIVGVAAAIDRPGVKKRLRLFGAAVLVLFGVATVLGAFGLQVLPGLALGGGGVGLFLGALLLTLSNPLTILFWAGVFAGKVAELGMGKRDVWVFGAGALLSTVVSLTTVALVGSLAGAVLPDLAIRALNAAVGAALVVFGIRMWRKK